MKTLLIVYHSRTGGTRQMAEAAATGAAAEPGVDVGLLQATAAGPDDVLAADGYIFIFAAPENLAALAGLMKDFFDRSYYPVLGQVNGRPYGLLICAGRTARMHPDRQRASRRNADGGVDTTLCSQSSAGLHPAFKRLFFHPIFRRRPKRQGLSPRAPQGVEHRLILRDLILSG
jgi:hypothetical protein